MSDQTKSQDDDRMAVAPPEPETGGDDHPAVIRSDAGTDESIDARLARNPESKEARLDTGLDQSMDASDPLSSTQPVHNNEPAPSSGYNEALEKKLAEGQGS